MRSRAALPLFAALALLALATSAQAGWGHHGGPGGWKNKGGGFLPEGVTADQVAAVRLTFANGTTVDKPFPPAPRAGGGGGEGGKNWGGGGHKNWGGDANAAGGGGGWKNKKGPHGGPDGAARPQVSFVLKDGTVVAKPPRAKPFAKEDVKSVTATFADGTTKTLPLPGADGAPPQRPPPGGPFPTSITIELKNGTKITKNPPPPPKDLVPKEEIKSVTATFADGTTKALPLPGSDGAPPQRPPPGTPRPTSITIELKNGSTITKAPFRGPPRP